MQNVKTVYLNALRDLFPEQMGPFDNSITMAMQSIMGVQRAIGQRMGEVTMYSQSPSEYLRELSKYSVVLADLYDYLGSLLRESAPDAKDTGGPGSVYEPLYQSPFSQAGKKEKSSPVDIELKALAGESLFAGASRIISNMEEEDRVVPPGHIPEIPFASRPEANDADNLDDMNLFDDIDDILDVPEASPKSDDGVFFAAADNAPPASVPVDAGNPGGGQAGTNASRPTAYVFRREERKFRTYGAALCDIAVYLARFNPEQFVLFCNANRSDPVFARTVSNDDAMISQMTGAMCIVRGYFVDNDRDDPALAGYISKMLTYFGLQTEEFYLIYGNEGG